MAEPGAGANSSRCTGPAALSGRENFPYSFKSRLRRLGISVALVSSLRCGPRARLSRPSTDVLLSRLELFFEERSAKESRRFLRRDS